MKPIYIFSAMLFLPPASSWGNGVTTNDLFRADIVDEPLNVEEPSCGQDTVAVITTKANDVYLFRVDKDAKTAVIEIKADTDDSTRLDETLSPVELLQRVVPVGTAIPEHVLTSLRAGKSPQRAEPFKVGRWDPIAAQAAAGAERATCSTPSLGMSPSAFFNNTTFCGWISGSSASANNTNWHAHGASFMNIVNEGQANHAGPHLPPYEFYFANEDEQGDARYGRARVRSCGGSTRLRSWVRASPTTGSWNQKWSWIIPSGYISTMAYYSNTQHSMWMGYDADDIYFKAEALGSASFGSRLYFFKYAYGENCDLKY